jgi:hypothetical protein
MSRPAPQDDAGQKVATRTKGSTTPSVDEIPAQLRRRRQAADRLMPYAADRDVRDPIDELRDELLSRCDRRRWCCLSLTLAEAKALGREGLYCGPDQCARELAEQVA